MKIRSFFVFLAALLIPLSVFAQKPPIKKNSRPSGDAQSLDSAKPPVLKKGEIVYAYEFEKPEFLISKIVIEHDENGSGEIRFRGKDFEDDVVEPLSISTDSLEKLKELWKAVRFLESEEKFQSDERDYHHLGTMKLRMKFADNERTEVFNWTENMDVQALYQEYRKIGNFAVWKFDFEVARQNQPLRTPRMMTALDSYLRRNAISDPKHIVPFLKKLSEDESVPLIARNHASRLAAQIEKENQPKKEEKTEKAN